MNKHIAIGAVAASLGIAGTGAIAAYLSGSPAKAQRASAGNALPDFACSRLAALKLDGVEIRSAKVQPAEAVVEGAHRPDMTGEPHGAPVKGLVSFCRVSGILRPEAGSNTEFEVWLPAQGWNGRLFGANNGGFAGSIRYDDLAAAVKNGAVGTATDGGHRSSDGMGWAKNRAQVRDYGWRALHAATVAAKALTRGYYGRPQSKSYFVGCSNGGRMALMAATRFPADYDGIVAGAPVVSWTGSAMTGLYILRAQQKPGGALRKEQAAFVQAEVLKQCDGLDGQRDGLVVNPLQCRFDYSQLSCAKSKSPQCFSGPQIASLKAISDGPRDKAGRQISDGFPLNGAEIGVANVGWDSSYFPSRNSMIGPLLTQFPVKPFATEANFDFNVHPAMLRADPGGELDPTTDLSRFFARGGKMIMWHGWSDAVLSPTAALNYYRQALKVSGPKAAASLRMFMLPGVDHCSGGPGADAIGQIGAPPPADTPDRNVAKAVVDWVEKGRVPQSLIGRHGNADIANGASVEGRMERLHCAWPALPVLRQGANRDKGSSYTCRLPTQVRS